MNTKNLINASYRLPNGLIFKVLSVEPYNAKEVSKQYESILAIKPGYLVAINYRGTLIPNMTLDGGVARLTSIEVDNVKISKPKAISKTLGIENNVNTYLLKKLS